VRALLGLAIVACWLGGALFHVHEGSANPDCRVCQALQANQADLTDQVAAPAPSIRFERLAPSYESCIASSFRFAPSGRAPPLV